MRILSFIKYEIFYGIFARISVVVAITYYFEETRNSMLLSFLKYFYISPKSEQWRVREGINTQYHLTYVHFHSDSHFQWNFPRFDMFGMNEWEEKNGNWRERVEKWKKIIFNFINIHKKYQIFLLFFVS